MKLVLHRLFDNKDCTIGILFFRDRFRKPVYIWTLEDEHREEKVKHETRIPAGRYKVITKSYGRIYDKYLTHRSSEISDFTIQHGVLKIEDVEGFSEILIHIGNDEGDTSGCLLTGMTVNNTSFDDGMIGHSTEAYIRLIREIGPRLDNGEEIVLEIYDTDRAFIQDL